MMTGISVGAHNLEAYERRHARAAPPREDRVWRDHNPEQWPEPVWREDVRLMREAGASQVSVGIFAWAMLEPAPGEYDFGWPDRIIALLHGVGIAVNLATPTAGPPAWFLRRHPQARQVTREGHILGGGARHGFCPSSPAYRAADRDRPCD
ncbi:beta-galactosidase [Micromonospora sp. KC213]|uniref:beta-galactosidase n=1 Tax=Micromonospora sp. KC213 TaxID=2530378 RepID=UPI001A9DB247|nr:beta-galactosidase [Micromonospora sp. KC213]